LSEPVVQRHQILAPAHEQVLAKLITAEHLQHQAAEVAETILPGLEERSALAAQEAGMRERPPRRLGLDGTGNPRLVGAAEASKQEWPRHAPQSNSGPFLLMPPSPVPGRPAPEAEDEDEEEDDRDGPHRDPDPDLAHERGSDRHDREREDEP
jgi:hypothetical protein